VEIAYEESHYKRKNWGLGEHSQPLGGERISWHPERHDELRRIRFPRCVVPVVPLEGQFKNPLLMVVDNGSREACCSLV
jgi:hypothetical protein